jgi:hypothetical protein
MSIRLNNYDRLKQCWRYKVESPRPWRPRRWRNLPVSQETIIAVLEAKLKELEAVSQETIL